MFYSEFRIRNFKGIKDTTVKLSNNSNVGVFAFVGLNESGKTTILEAIHSFSPDLATSELLGGSEKEGVPFSERVPRHLISSFTGDVIVTASLRFDPGEKERLFQELEKTQNIIIDSDNMEDEIKLEKIQRFRNGDFLESDFVIANKLSFKTEKKQKKWRTLEKNEEHNKIRDFFFNHAPVISYFPTFVFDFPKRIFLTTERTGSVNKFYRGAFQDILDYDGKGHTIEESIVRRVRSEDKKKAWVDFLKKWTTSEDKGKIQHVIDRASSVVTEVVFGRWNDIFGENTAGKEIVISFNTIEGEIVNPTGGIQKTHEHDIYIEFQIKDGTRRFDVNDRSLGFRWFFAFMLFTQFRAARENGKPVFFLFDEPASNLHAAAQKKLIESFPEIARDGHTLAYTTHSHYMIEPKWLEQTYIVTNRADTPSSSVIDGLSLDDESLDVKATRYKEFVNKNPSKTSYFQPILDRLEVVPSSFDIKIRSIVVEGKSDYYILRYALKLLDNIELSIIPGLGSGTFDSLIALDVGWGLNMLYLLDGDGEGKKAQEKYLEKFGLPDTRIIRLDNIDTETKEIEDILDEEAKKIIAVKLGIAPSDLNKKDLLRFFQENLASGSITALGKYFETKTTKILNALHQRISETAL